MRIMRRDNDSKADTLDFDNDIFGVPRDFMATEDPLEMVAYLLSFVVVCDDGAA